MPNVIERTEVIDTPVVEIGEKATTPVEVTDEIKFEDLTPAQQRFVDRERNKASQTARDRAKREALKDPDVRKAISAELEAEATLTAEQKLERRIKEVQVIENRALAREKLVSSGIIGDDLTEILETMVSEDSDATMKRIDKIVNVVTKVVSAESEKHAKLALRNTPIPTTSPTVTKPFKELSYEDRRKLKETDYARYKAEMEKLRVKI